MTLDERSTNFLPLLLVEVITLAPFDRRSNDVSSSSSSSSFDDVCFTHKRCPLSAPLAKLQLLNLSRQRHFSRGWLQKVECGGQSHRGLWLKADVETHCNKDVISGNVLFGGKDENLPRFQSYYDTGFLQTFLRPDDPLEEKIPCQIRGYVSANNRNSYRCIRRQSRTKYLRCVVADETIVYVKQLADDKEILSLRVESIEYQADCLNPQQSTPSYSKLSSYDPETVQSLALRMSTILSNAAWIGTDLRALCSKTKEQNNFISMKNELNDFWETSKSKDVTAERVRANASPSLLTEGALLVYNSHPASGKTTLVKTIASEVLKCQVHVITAVSLLAKYGTSADAALESILHELALKSAIKGTKICVILDHFESFVPSAAADPYFPTLHAMTSFLNRLSFSLRDKKEFPFPSLNALYNVRSGGGYSGLTFPVRFCLVGVITNRNDKIFHDALDALGGSFYVPLPSTTTRCAAFEHAFDCVGVRLDAEARDALPKLTASKWASGGAFVDVAYILSSTELEVSKRDLEKAMSSRYYAVNPEAEDQSISSFPNLEGATSTLSNVGGNADAKLALEDALALDARKRKLLASFGLRAPTGVLLFGPPGTGKTMLAREVAMSLRNQSNKSKCNTIGSFISLKASEIVRPEVGNSEKLIVSAFRMARANAPSVVFIDEFQALFGDRGGSSVVLGQLASTLLQCMDDLQKWSEIATTSDDNSHNGRIVVLAATNTPWMVDKAFLRPGRFDRAVHVGLPNLCDREDILRVHTKTMKIEPSEVDDLCKSMAKLCIGFSGADLASLCKAAAVRCLHNGEEKTGIRKGHFVDAFENDVVRSSSDELVKRISSWTA